MASKQLAFIATTPVRERQRVMPRIRCVDGVSLSVQASSQHYSRSGSQPKSDVGPWSNLEVAFLSIGVPMEWNQYFVENHGSALKNHDSRGAVETEFTPVYSVPYEVVEGFIEAHGGEIASQVDILRAVAERKYQELLIASAEEDRQLMEIRRAMSSLTYQDVAEKEFVETFFPRYDAALKKSHRLFDEWRALLDEASKLRQQELEEIERELNAIEAK